MASANFHGKTMTPSVTNIRLKGRDEMKELAEASHFRSRPYGYANTDCIEWD